MAPGTGVGASLVDIAISIPSQRSLWGAPLQPCGARLIHFGLVGGRTCSVERTSRAPSACIASVIALLMSSAELTEPESVTIPAVVFTEMLRAERLRSVRT